VNKDEIIVKSLLKWHQRHRRIFPWREEKERDPYKSLVAEFFLQRTPANRVAAFLPIFLQEFPSPLKLAKANVAYLENVSHGLGLKKRILWLVESMKIICQKYEGEVPNKLEDLISLPGVGNYTAAAVLCFGFGRGVPIVDANVVRVLTRIFGLQETQRTGSNTLKEIARRLLPKGQAVAYNEALLDFAAVVCKKRPLCGACPLTNLCDYYRS